MASHEVADFKEKTYFSDEKLTADVELEQRKAEYGFKGDLLFIGTEEYKKCREQYATTSFPKKDMSPGMILYAKNEDDVVKAINICREKGMKMAIRTGGHQYCGYSSTSAANMQLDMSVGFEQYEYDAAKNRLVCGPSWSLGPWAMKNNKNHIYLPMGICADVHLGGHCHTGGWGMMARSHGLLADHCVAFNVVLGDGSKARIVKPETDDHKQAEADGKLHADNDDLFYAVLGGSIGGTFGVVTQFEFEPIKDADHPNAACYLMAWTNNEARTRGVTDLMQKYTDMCAKGEIPSDYEFMLTITDSGTQVKWMPKEMHEAVHQRGHVESDEHLQKVLPAVVQMWMCYTNKGGKDETFDNQWFEKFVEVLGTPDVIDKRIPKLPVSFGLANMYIMHGTREADCPFIKRAQASTKLPENFTDVYTERIEDVPLGVSTVSQLQIYAGSAIKANEATSHTSYSFRDMEMVLIYDAFYDTDTTPDAYSRALQWQDDNYAAFVGDDGAFAKEDLRLFAYTWGERDIEKAWPLYYDNEDKYQRLRVIKTKADADAIFNASSMGVPPAKHSHVYEHKLKQDLEKRSAEYGFEGDLVLIGAEDYQEMREQYATTSFPKKDMSPGMILYAKNEDDVVKAINICREKGMKMAIRTGGHQYCGYSSTSAANMQLDMSVGFQNYEYDAAKNRLICGPSWSLGPWAVENNKNGIYLPMGICADVHLGGHCHTGGWGMVARSHGLLADHCVAFNVVLGDGSKARIVKPETDDHKQAEADGKLHADNDDLFYAVLGGSIGGTFGVVTQFEFEPIKDADHPNAACYVLAWVESPERTRKVAGLMQKYTEMCESGEIPSDYEFMLTITDSGTTWVTPAVHEEMHRRGHVETDEHLEKILKPLIAMWMCYTNKDGEKKAFDPQWFDKFIEVVGEPDVLKAQCPKTPISYGIPNMFIMHGTREADCPYIKRAQTTLKMTDKFAEVYAKRISSVPKGVSTVSQLQIYAGSAIQANEATSHTSYPFRKMQMVLIYDAFYATDIVPDAYSRALQWQDENYAAFVGDDGAFSEKDLRLFAYTWGERDIEKAWPLYYEDEDTYKRLRAIKTKADADAIFNASSMGVPPA